MLAGGPNLITISEFLNHGRWVAGPHLQPSASRCAPLVQPIVELTLGCDVRPWNTIPFLPEEGSEEWSCGWWAFRTTRDVDAGEELLYDHSFWGYDLPYVGDTHAPGAVSSPFKHDDPSTQRTLTDL